MKIRNQTKRAGLYWKPIVSISILLLLPNQKNTFIFNFWHPQLNLFFLFHISGTFDTGTFFIKIGFSVNNNQNQSISHYFEWFFFFNLGINIWYSMIKLCCIVFALKSKFLWEIAKKKEEYPSKHTASFWRPYNVHNVKRRRTDFKTTSCAYWDKISLGFFHSSCF